MASAPAPPGRPRPRLPDLDTFFTINPDGSRNFLHPADVRGRWQRRKNAVFATLLGLFLVLPWLEVGGRPAVLFDIPNRRAFLFGATFTNQDTWLLFFLLTGAGFALIVATSLFGRVWCGYACPQTVLMEGVFRRLERWLEGPRERRIQRNAGPPTLDTAWRKLVKHVLFAAGCLLVSHTFVAYFFPARELLRAMASSPGAHWTAFLWAVVMGTVLYVDFAWFREQTCLVLCPYGRLQSTLIDDDTVIIGYDARRGEPRVRLGAAGGDCVDCRRCVLVCPTGIDIRNGLQLECVGCANCIDACDEVMERIGRARGLVRYDSRRGFEGEARRLLRPRVLLYLGLGVLGLAAATAATSRREPFEVRVLRPRGMPYLLEQGTIRNLFNLSVQNKQPEPRAFTIREAAKPDAAEVLIAQREVRLEPFAEATVPVFVTVAEARYREPFALELVVTDAASGHSISAEARFLGP